MKKVIILGTILIILCAVNTVAAPGDADDVGDGGAPAVLPGPQAARAMTARTRSPRRSARAMTSRVTARFGIRFRCRRDGPWQNCYPGCPPVLPAVTALTLMVPSGQASIGTATVRYEYALGGVTSIRCDVGHGVA